MAQTHFYPAASVSSTCKSCYASESSRSASACNGSNKTPYCGSCNVTCDSKQDYPTIGPELIKSHGDVRSFSGFNANPEDYIFEKWTTTKWNDLQGVFIDANSVGKTQKQGASLSFTPVFSGVPITADQYNSFVDAFSDFGYTIDSVVPNQVITATLSDALDSGYSNSKFKSGVCDICNTGTQHNCGYNCSCNYNCCNYNCSCNHQCSCHHQDTSSSSGGSS